MSEAEAIATCVRIHLYFMAMRRFWYDKDLQEADKLFCVAASDLRQKKQAQRAT